MTLKSIQRYAVFGYAPLLNVDARTRWRLAWQEWRGLYDRRLSAVAAVAADYDLPARALVGTVCWDTLGSRMPGRLLNWPKGWVRV